MAPFECKSNSKKLGDKKLLDAEINWKLSERELLSFFSKFKLKGSRSLSNLSDFHFLNVESLNLSNNCLSNLPTNFKYLNKLKFLDLSGNTFEKLPTCFSQGLISLESLNFSRNILKDFTVKKSSLQSLRHLNLKGNKLNTIPDWLLSWNCCPLQVLNLSENSCLKNIIGTGFFEKFNLVHLMKRSISRTVNNLSLSNCQVTTRNSILLLVFDSVLQLDLSNDFSNDQSSSYNYIPHLPCASMERMKRLTVLNVANVSLANLSDSIAKFTNLRVLNAKDNSLSWIPDSFCGLASLEVCDLSNNRIFELPKNIEKLRCLRVLILAFNRLRFVPENLQKHGNLQVLDLYMNEITEPLNELHSSNLIGLDLERNFFNTRTIELRNADYAKLRDAYRQKYDLRREKGKKVYERHSGSSSSSRSCSGSSQSSGKLESDVNNDMVNSCIEPKENWDDEMSYEDSLDEFDPDVHGLAVRPGGFVWRHRLWFGDLWKPLQCRMFGNMRCQNQHDTVIRADIPETRSNCFMANDWITEDYAEYMPFVIHPHCIIYEDEVRKWSQIPPVEGQFDDAEE